ncbi:MAG: glucose 1-dehydrogenase [Planctomycetota bacterium]|nr:glucose 1-dehydrogenase [Planctomycetota bacterium]MDA1213635.1 glucose 1-dehydrogenase [Planctomycetota bacterium]
MPSTELWNDLFDLTGHVAVVTGGAQGLGWGMAKGLASYGADVVLIDVKSDDVNAAANVLSAETGRSITAKTCDIKDRDVVEQCIGEIVATSGRIDILINNAGIHRRVTPVDFQQNDLDDVIAVNLLGNYYMTGAVARQMIAQKSGSIINISALGGGLLGLGRGGSIYGITKGGIVALTRDLAAEWAKHNIRVNSIAPGWMRTPITTALQNDPVRSQKVLERVPLRRWGDPKDIAGLAVFLASEASSYITGVTIPIDGGAANTIMLEEIAPTV